MSGISNRIVLTAIAGAALSVTAWAAGGRHAQRAPAISVAVSPSTASITVSATQQFACKVANSSNQTCYWSVQERGGGTVSASGLYTAPATAGTYHVIATAAADRKKKASATVTVTAPPPPPPPPPPVTISISPATASVTTGAAQQFACTVTGSTNTACTFAVQEGAAGGTVSASGLYTAPATAGTYHVVATAAADTTKKASATVNVSNVTNPASSAWVTGYYGGYFWEFLYPPEEVDMSAMTHFVFARIAPGGGSLGGTPGTIVEGAGSAHEPNPFAPDPSVPVDDWLVARAHAAGTKALLMFGGDGDDGIGFNLSSSDALRPAFVKRVVDYLVEHNYDGIDMDWENRLLDGCPASECGVAIDGQESVRRLVQLTKDIRAEANSRPRYQNNPIIITFAHYVKRKGETVEPYQVQMGQIVDQYNMMSYGVGSTWFGAGWASWFTSPIYGAYYGDSSAPVDLDSSIAAYVAAGIPRNRIGIGIGFYGVPYGPPITGPRQATDGVDAYFSINDLPWAYYELKKRGFLDHGTYAFDQVAQSAYRSYPGGGYSDGDYPAIGYLSYENGQSIQAKGKYVRETGAGGTIIWLLNYGYVSDRPDGKLGTNTPLADVKCAFLQRGCPGPMTP